MCRLLLLFAPIILFTLLSWPRTAHAQLIFNLNPAGQQGDLGTTLTFNATLENSGNVPLFLNGDLTSTAGNGLTVDTSLFFQNAPLSMNVGDTWSGDIFTVAIDPATLPGDYTGSFTITGGTDAAALDNLATQYFLVTVLPTATVPEPSALAVLMGMTVSGGLLLRRRYKRG